MSPRRSSRSKTSHPTPATQHANSSSSSISSGRADCRSRSGNKLPSPRSSVAPGSPSLADREVSSNPQTRRTRSNQETPKVEANADNVNEDGGDEHDEEEVTRCVCGQQEYPGVPATASKSNGDPGDAGSPTTLQEDTGGLFIQCDKCKVWQHGGCVGIMDEATSPDEYFCEQCRTDLHSVTSTAAGQKYSLYLPLQEVSPPQSPSSPPLVPGSTRDTKENRSSRSNHGGSAGKRRSTMNSRDAAYYEAEQLRRAIEESKKDGTLAPDVGSRKGKRSREESDQQGEGSKRRRTDSGSSASSSDRHGAKDAIVHEIEAVNAAASTTGKNIRGAPARNQGNKDLREREEKQQKDRLDAANKRNGRAERRRVDESDPSEKTISRTTSSKGRDQAPVETPPASQTQPRPKASHHKKTGRPPARRGRVGRNQYTRDRERPGSPKNANDATSPANSNSSKEGHQSPRVNGHSHETGKQSKVRHMNPNRTTMNDMKRRAAGILEFIGRTRVEMAAEVPLLSALKSASASASSSSSSSSNALATAKPPVTPPESAQITSSKDSRVWQLGDQQQSKLAAFSAELDLDQFKHLDTLEMMEILTGKIVQWQEEYGKYGEK
ncbi:MAG: hypothetical protein LQ348_000252 [Seirophora lacunosa]|nr:MAG: hypothetical protein LQ344_002256 [Seirophora lacunosa]KAI4208328.1 MAG: hypothetical protein LQ348_000252 [Seirophora lacunosa]